MNLEVQVPEPRGQFFTSKTGLPAPEIPEKDLFIYPKNWEVIDQLTLYTPIKDSPVQFATVVPRVPRIGDFPTGFEMRLVRVNGRQLSTNPNDRVTLTDMGEAGFLLTSPIGPMWLDKKTSLETFIKVGYGPRITNLNKSLARKRAAFRYEPEKWKEIAHGLTPLLAHFYVKEPIDLPIPKAA